MNNGEGNGIRTIVNYVCRKYKISIKKLNANKKVSVKKSKDIDKIVADFFGK